MIIRILAFIMILSLSYLYVADTANAIEFKPLLMKNVDGIDTITGVIGEPLIFHHTISNDEDSPIELDVMFATNTHDDTTLDEQTKLIKLEPRETKAVTYQFIPTSEENYVTSVSHPNYRFADSISYPALEKTKDYQKQKVRLYSGSSDQDCLIACTAPSELTITAGTLVEWTNTSSVNHSISTGNYKEDEKGISWTYDKRFAGIIGPNEKFVYLFSEPGEYQYFLAEHRKIQVVGTIHVTPEGPHLASDRTIDILQEIMEDESSDIPITSLHVNPKNSIITVGVDDRKNPLFTLDLYKKMIYNQVGDVFLDIVVDNAHKANPCDVNDEIKVRDALERDPVVKQFLKYYPNATFEHFKTSDEPGNPRTYSEFRYELFLLRILVLTHDQNGDCYPVYNYSVSYDDPMSEPRKKLLANQYTKSEDISKAIDAVKKLSNPIRQHEYGISNQDISCKDGFVVLVNQHRQTPSCITKETSLKLLDRGWSIPASYSDVSQNNDDADESKSEKVPVHEIRIEGLKNTYDIFEPIEFTIIMESYGIDHGEYEISINGVDEKTNGKIEKIFERLDPQTKLAITNAIYFKGIWAIPFDKEKTVNGNFYVNEKTVIQVPMMELRTTYLNFARNDHVHILELPYEGDRISMLILLPNEADGIESLETSLLEDNLDKWIEDLQKRKVKAHLPKFELETQYDLVTALQEMGIHDAFGNADFSGISDSGLYIYKAIHKAFVDVNEEGTEAAAATGMAMLESGPIPFTVDHPFVFLIQDNDTGQILFMGRVTDPTK